MTLNDSSSVIVDLPTRGTMAGDKTVVWLGGEHDLATVEAICDGVSVALRRSSGEVVVDLSAVTFMDASTVGAIVRSRAAVMLASRSLSVRAPSESADRVLGMCTSPFATATPGT